MYVYAVCACVHFLEYLLQFAHLKPFEKWNKFVHSFEHFVFEFSKQKRICFLPSNLFMGIEIEKFI